MVFQSSFAHSRRKHSSAAEMRGTQEHADEKDEFSFQNLFKIRDDCNVQRLFCVWRKLRSFFVIEIGMLTENLNGIRFKMHVTAVDFVSITSKQSEQKRS